MIHVLLNWVDIVLLTVITLTAYDALRQLHPSQQPIRAITFALISIGGFGWIAFDLRNENIAWWALMFHGGIAIHSVIRFMARNHLEVHHHVGLTVNDRRMAAKPDRRQAKR